VEQLDTASLFLTVLEIFDDEAVQNFYHLRKYHHDTKKIEAEIEKVSA
jgi:hypothetical protein